MALTITAVNTMAIRIMTGIRKGFFLIVLAGAAGGMVATGVPHLWQKRAFSSSLVPHLRQ